MQDDAAEAHTPTTVGPVHRIGTGTRNRDRQDARDGVPRALKVGCRQVGNAEGQRDEKFALRALADGGVSRDWIVLTTKGG